MLWLWLALAQGACEERSEAVQKATTAALEGLVIQSRQVEDPSGMVERVVKLHKDGHLCSANDKLRASVILLRGDGEALLIAHTLATESYTENPLESAGRAAAQAMDLRRVRMGEPQSYGVHRGRDDGGICLFPIDPDVTDEERIALGLPGLEGLLQEFIDKTEASGEPTIEAFTEGGHFCPLMKQEVKPDEEFSGLDPDSADDDPYEGQGATTNLTDGGQAARGRKGATLTHGELYGQYGYWSGNAYTVDKGQLIIHPFMRSVYGVAEGVQIGTNILSNLAIGGVFTDVGPLGGNLHAEVAPFQSDDGAVSIEGGFATPLITENFLNSYHVYGEFKGTGYLSNTVSITGALMGARHLYSDQRRVDRLRPKLSLEISFSPSAMAILNFRTDVLSLKAGGDASIGGGAYVAYATGLVGLSFGLNADVQQFDSVTVNGEDVDVAWAVLPSPHAQIWFRPGKK